MAKSPDPFRWLDSSPEATRLVVMMDIRYPLSLRNVEDLLFERGIGICHEAVRLWWNRFGPSPCSTDADGAASLGLAARLL
jgi:putative transposase